MHTCKHTQIKVIGRGKNISRGPNVFFSYHNIYSLRHHCSMLKLLYLKNDNNS